MDRFRRFALASAMGISVGSVISTAPCVYAQQTQASLTGLIEDNTGSTVPSAEVEIINTDTNISRKVMSDSAGRYLVSNLNPGKYSLRVTMQGFSQKELKGIVLNVGAQESLDVKLDVGAVTDVIDVQAEASVTSTESASQGSVINNQQVVGLPLNTRSFYGLATLSPAAYLPAQNSTLGFRGGFNVAGNNETANTFTVNGIDDNDQNVMAPSFRPSVEGIQEFKLLTGIYSAEYGRTSGGQVVVITKTGTNQFHGDAFEFIRNRITDAKNVFTLPGLTPAFRRNQFGGTLGGPIVKDRTFFFVNYEGLRLAQQIALQGAVPQTAWHNGDFSSLCTAGFSAAGLCSNTAQQLYRPTAPLAARTPYLGNQVLPSDFSPLGQRLLNYFPAPDVAGSSTYTLNRTRVENLDEISGRIDHKLGEHDTLLAQYNWFNDPSFEPSNSLCGSSALPGFGCYTNQRSLLAGVNYTHIFNEHWINEFRAGWDRLVQPRTGEDASNGFPILPGAFNDPGDIRPGTYGGTPNVAVSGYSTLHPYTNLPQRRWDNHYNLVNNAQWTHGAHNLKFGVNLLQARYSDYYIAYATGSFSFNSASSAGGGVPTTGNSVADLLTGYAYSSTRSPSAPFIRALYSSYGAYTQDDWKVSPYLTLNAGVRYEYFSPTRDAKNIIANIIPAQVPFGSYNATTIQQLGIQVAGATGNLPDYVYNGDVNNFAPRLGLSWEPFHTDATVVHAGFGTYYSSPAIGNGANLSMSLNVPFRLNQTFTSTPAAGTFVQLDANPFPGSTNQIHNAQTGYNYFNSATPTGLDQNFATLYLNEYAADVQQQFTKSLVLTLGYIGNEGARIPRYTNLNQGIVTATTATSVTAVRPYRANGTPGTAADTNDACVSTYAQACYNNFGNVGFYIATGHSAYHAMTLKAQQQYSHGLSFIAAYTWSKSIDNAPGYASSSQSSSGTPQDSHNLQAERGLSDFDVRHRFVFSPVYELPFGKNKAFLTHGLGSAVAGGWQLSSLTQVSTGRPFSIYNSSSNRSGSFNNSDRPNLVPGQDPNAGPRTRAQWFNTAAFTNNAFGTFGNAGRNILVGPGYVNVDLAIQRTFPIIERTSLLVRAEGFNIFNKVNYLNPLGTTTGELGAGSYGQLTAANDPRQMQFSAKILF